MNHSWWRVFSWQLGIYHWGLCPSFNPLAHPHLPRPFLSSLGIISSLSQTHSSAPWVASYRLTVDGVWRLQLLTDHSAFNSGHFCTVTASLQTWRAVWELLWHLQRHRDGEKYSDLFLMILWSGLTVVCPGDAWRSLGMFLYKALKHRDEEEDIQVHTQWLGDTARAVEWLVCFGCFFKPAVCGR